MGKFRKIVGVSLAIALVAAVAVYVLMPRPAVQNTTVALQPPTPTNNGSGATNPGSGGTGPQTPPSDHTRPDKLHGQNSNGPKHVVCLWTNDHVQGMAQYQGANWYRGACAQAPGANSQGTAHAADIARIAGARGTP